MFDDYSLMVSDPKQETTKGTGLKTLTPKQMFQRLPIAVTQVLIKWKLIKWNQVDCLFSLSIESMQ